MGKLNLYTGEQFQALRQKGDPLADRVIADLIENPGLTTQINSWSEIPLELPESFPDSLVQFFSFFHQRPSFINNKRVKISQDYFEKEGNLYMAMLGFYSLPYSYAFADGAQVLVRSKRITEEAGKRLSETALFLLDTYRPGTFLTDDRALLSIAKVRLIHAFSRFFVRKYAKDWNDDWGIPVNQEDLIGTNLAFSLMVMRGMEKMNQFPGKEIHESVLHYWKIVGHYLGIEADVLPDTSKEAFELEKLIRKRHARSSEAGRILIQSLLNYYISVIPDPSMSKLTETLVAFFVGKEIAVVLGIKETVALPDNAVGLILKLNFLKQNGINSSYAKIRQIFLEQNKVQFGSPVALNIPAIKRP
ncbi:hypothetical protein P872_05145 [Rhodonellum psychrophilum GCM71 = DSM 17998]|uniref:ER-bound oxygenase mpaB/mpaB'/Rubber oxygenase catalytic domain-containing protein n=2 Tax=Rhodonellum TaxID=336827 RepID=U5C480_9BACT|nr:MULTISPECIES: oxygenase MpaB family protein [Rhodonellum]ERM83002.1 hypothetical protein P872_05145 [Rhodonellum psychrophilum GCM71 = DSM 17998]SDZ36056.1 hypothetical protein SAMN05444412_11180 [Rhodonellum ikkaensis]